MAGVCTIDECGKPSITKGLCHMHYRRLRKYGDPMVLKKPHMLEIQGQRFTKLVAVEKAGTNEKGERFWLCQCDCGKTKEVTGSALVAGKIKSCGQCGYMSQVTAKFNRETKAVPAEIRFHRMYAVNPQTGCWEWKRALDKMGYGLIHVGPVMEKASRYSWRIHFGEIPPGEGYHGTCVCHHCDNPACVNPSHLFLGSMQDNIDDMMAKGRNRTCRDGKREVCHGI